MRKFTLLLVIDLLISQTTVPFYQFLHNKHKEHYYTTNPSPKGDWKSQGIAFYAYTEQAPGTVPIYQFLHKKHKDHFLTKNAKPKGDWKAQGIAFYAYAEQAPNTIPFYRFYSTKFKDHYYTKKPDPKGDWKHQGIEFYTFENEKGGQNIEGRVFSFGMGKTKDEAIDNALYNATKTALSVIEQKPTTKFFNEKGNLFTEKISDYKVLMERNEENSVKIILSSILPNKELRDIFQIEQEEKESVGLFADDLKKDLNENQESEIEFYSFFYFLQPENFDENFYDINNFSYGKPINALNYKKGKTYKYDYVIENNLEFSLNKHYRNFHDMLLYFVQLHAFESIPLKRIEYVSRNAMHDRILRYKDYPVTLSLSGEDYNKISERANLYSNEESLVYNNFVIHLDSSSSIYRSRSIPIVTGAERGLDFDDLTIYKLKSNVPNLIANYITELLIGGGLGYETTFTFTDNETEKFRLWYNFSLKGNKNPPDKKSLGLFIPLNELYHGSFAHVSNDICVFNNDVLVPSEFEAIPKMATFTQTEHITKFSFLSENFNHPPVASPQTKKLGMSKTYVDGNGIQHVSHIQFNGTYMMKKEYLSKIKSIDVRIYSNEENQKYLGKYLDEVAPFKEENKKVAEVKASQSRTIQHSSGCSQSGAKSFAINRIKNTIGNVQFLDLYDVNQDRWLFYGSAYSNQYARDVTVFVLIGCSDGVFDVLNVDIQLN